MLKRTGLHITTFVIVLSVETNYQCYANYNYSFIMKYLLFCSSLIVNCYCFLFFYVNVWVCVDESVVTVVFLTID